MNHQNRNAWIALMILTATTTYLANLKSAAYFIIGIAVIKIGLVSFQFMDLRNAHLFWKTAITGLILLFAVIIVFLLN